MKEAGFDFPEVDIVRIWEEILSIMIEENFISGDFDENTIRIAALTYECKVNPVWPMKGIEQLLNHLYKSGLKLGIISNAQFYTPEILKVLINFKTGHQFFDRELLFYSFKENLAKPSKDFFLKAVRKVKKLYNIDSDEILYIGNDMLNDVYTASLCGCKTALFAGDKRSLRLRQSDLRCKDLKPDLVITELEQLIEIL
jgi:putative hydrolase of the HAD superfamily